MVPEEEPSAAPHTNEHSQRLLAWANEAAVACNADRKRKACAPPRQDERKVFVNIGRDRALNPLAAILQALGDGVWSRPHRSQSDVPEARF